MTSESGPQLSSVTSKSGALSSTVSPPPSDDGEGGGSSNQSHSTSISQSRSVEVVTTESGPQLSSISPQPSDDAEGGGSSSQSSVAAGIGGGIAAAVVLLIAVVVVVVVLVCVLQQRKAVDMRHEERADAYDLDNPVYSGRLFPYGMGQVYNDVTVPTGEVTGRHPVTMSALQFHQTGTQEDLYEVPCEAGGGHGSPNNNTYYVEVTRDRVDEPSCPQESEIYRKVDNPLYGDI